MFFNVICILPCLCLVNPNDQSGLELVHLMCQSHNPAGIVAFYVNLFKRLCVCQHSETAMQQCWQKVTCLTPESLRTHMRTHAQISVLFVDSKPVFSGSFVPYSRLRSHPLCSVSLLYSHQDYRLCCSRLMTDISTLLSALRGTHRVTGRTVGPVVIERGTTAGEIMHRVGLETIC